MVGVQWACQPIMIQSRQMGLQIRNNESGGPVSTSCHASSNKWIVRICLVLVIGLGSFMIWLLFEPWEAQTRALTRQKLDSKKTRIQLNQKEIDLRAFRADAAHQRTDAKNLRKKHDSVSNELDQMRVQAKVVVNRNTTLEKTLQRRESEIAEFDKTGMKPADIARLQREHKQQQRDLKTAHILAADEKRTVRSLKTDLTAKANAASNASTAIVALKDEVRLLAVANRGMTRRNEILKDELDQVRNQSDRYSKNVSELQAEKTRLAREIAGVSVLRRQILEVQRQYNAKREENEGLRGRVANLTSRLSRLPYPQQRGSDGVGSSAKSKQVLLQVVRYDPTFEFAVVNFGSQMGAQIGQEFWVQRNGKIISRMNVRRVNIQQSWLRFSSGWDSVVLKAGDRIRPAAH